MGEEEEVEKEIGSVADAGTETTPSEASATDVSSLDSWSTTKLLPIPSGSLESAIGSVPVLFVLEFLLIFLFWYSF